MMSASRSARPVLRSATPVTAPPNISHHAVDVNPENTTVGGAIWKTTADRKNSSVAVGSGKGGVGKSTLTLHLAGALRARGLRIAILDADFNGPSQARMAGVQGAVFVPPPSPRGFGAASGSHKVALPRTRNGIGVFSIGSLIPESEALDF